MPHAKGWRCLEQLQDITKAIIPLDFIQVLWNEAAWPRCAGALILSSVNFLEKGHKPQNSKLKEPGLWHHFTGNSQPGALFSGCGSSVTCPVFLEPLSLIHI